VYYIVGRNFLPPAIVKTLKDLLFWQYAKIIAESAGMGNRDYGFVMDKFKQLKQSQISWSEINQYIKEKDSAECVFCGESANLLLERLLPKHFNGPDTEKNLVFVCKSCSKQKGAKRFYEYFAQKEGLETVKFGVPHIAEGKYLKLAFEAFKEKSFLDTKVSELNRLICPRCDMKSLCIRRDTEGELSPFCIDGVLTMCFKKSG
jgi:hypothetical protein